MTESRAALDIAKDVAKTWQRVAESAERTNELLERLVDRNLVPQPNVPQPQEPDSIDYLTDIVEHGGHIQIGPTGNREEPYYIRILPYEGRAGRLWNGTDAHKLVRKLYAALVKGEV